ncbi:MAG: hypothetical protein LIP77_09730 [Planctomycetes bacterium]|nr:hypothetical protein [Planctomycetota bacterium]
MDATQVSTATKAIADGGGPNAVMFAIGIVFCIAVIWVFRKEIQANRDYMQKHDAANRDYMEKQDVRYSTLIKEQTERHYTQLAKWQEESRASSQRWQAVIAKNEGALHHIAASIAKHPCLKSADISMDRRRE